MVQIEEKTEALKKSLLKMMRLTQKQLAKGKEAIVNFDKNLALDVMNQEKHVNAYELIIDEACENILALNKPVAVDLRFVLSVYKINNDLERIGDYAAGIARFVLYFENQFEKEVFEKVRFLEMYDAILSMYDDVIQGFDTEDTVIARSIFERDKLVNEINISATQLITPLLRALPEKTEQLLYLLSVIRKIERVGDLIKNIAEGTIFYVEAKVLKHQHELRK